MIHRYSVRIYCSSLIYKLDFKNQDQNWMVFWAKCHLLGKRKIFSFKKWIFILWVVSNLVLSFGAKIKVQKNKIAKFFFIFPLFFHSTVHYQSSFPDSNTTSFYLGELSIWKFIDFISYSSSVLFSNFSALSYEAIGVHRRLLLFNACFPTETRIFSSN